MEFIILIIDSIIEKRGISFRLHLMPVAVGMYLPFGLSTPILVGGLMAYLIQKQNKTVMNSDDSMQNGDTCLIRFNCWRVAYGHSACIYCWFWC